MNHTPSLFDEERGEFHLENRCLRCARSFGIVGSTFKEHEIKVCGRWGVVREDDGCEEATVESIERVGWVQWWMLTLLIFIIVVVIVVVVIDGGGENGHVIENGCYGKN